MQVRKGASNRSAQSRSTVEKLAQRDANLIDLLWSILPQSVPKREGKRWKQLSQVRWRTPTLLPQQSGSHALRVVHIAEVSYTPTGLLNTDLSRLQNPSDGSMDNVYPSGSVRADLVAYLQQLAMRGLASTMQHPSNNFESSGFNASVWDQLELFLHLAHEIGHNMGCLPGRIRLGTVITSCRPFLSGNAGTREAKVTEQLSYDSNPASYGNRIPFFKPERYTGTSVGSVGTEDNAQVLSITAPYVSNFRTSKVQAIFPRIRSYQKAIPLRSRSG